MNLINNETIVMEAGGEKASIILTSHRIRQEGKSWSHLQIKSISLEHISSCEYQKTSKPILLILGILGIIFGGIEISSSHYSNGNAILFIALGIILVIAYFLSFSKGIIVASNSMKIRINTTGMKEENIQTFITKLEMSKENKRINNF